MPPYQVACNRPHRAQIPSTSNRIATVSQSFQLSFLFAFPMCHLLSIVLHKWAVAKENSPLGDFHFFKKNRIEILKKIQARLRVHSFDDRTGRPNGEKKHEKRLRFFVGFAHCVCFVVSTMTSRRLSIDRVYSSSTAAAPTAEFLGEDDRDFFGELDELKSGDSVTLEEVSSSGRAQSLPSRRRRRGSKFV